MTTSYVCDVVPQLAPICFNSVTVAGKFDLLPVVLPVGDVLVSGSFNVVVFDSLTSIFRFTAPTHWLAAFILNWKMKTRFVAKWARGAFVCVRR